MGKWSFNLYKRWFSLLTIFMMIASGVPAPEAFAAVTLTHPISGYSNTEATRTYSIPLNGGIADLSSVRLEAGTLGTITGVSQSGANLLVTVAGNRTAPTRIVGFVDNERNYFSSNPGNSIWRYADGKRWQINQIAYGGDTRTSYDIDGVGSTPTQPPSVTPWTRSSPNFGNLPTTTTWYIESTLSGSTPRSISSKTYADPSTILIRNARPFNHPDNGYSATGVEVSTDKKSIYLKNLLNPLDITCIVEEGPNYYPPSCSGSISSSVSLTGYAEGRFYAARIEYNLNAMTMPVYDYSGAIEYTVTYPPTISASATPATAYRGSTVTFDCSATGSNGRTVSSIAWSGAVTGSAAALSLSRTATFSTLGTKSATCTAIDNEGDSASKTVSTEIINRIPTATITYPTGSSTAPVVVANNVPFNITWNYADGDSDPQSGYIVSIYSGFSESPVGPIKSWVVTSSSKFQTVNLPADLPSGDYRVKVDVYDGYDTSNVSSVGYFRVSTDNKDVNYPMRYVSRKVDDTNITSPIDLTPKKVGELTVHALSTSITAGVNNDLYRLLRSHIIDIYDTTQTKKFVAGSSTTTRNITQIEGGRMIVGVYDRPPVASNMSISTPEETAVSGSLSGTDPEAGTAGLVYSIVTQPGSGSVVLNNSSTGSFTYTPVTDVIGSQSFTYRVTDKEGLQSDVATVTINITDVPDAPTDLSLSNDKINENSPTGTVIGNLSSADIDSSSFSYNLVAGTGDTDNSSFSIVGNQLRSSAVFNYEAKSNYSVRIRTFDGSLSYSKPFAIYVLDVPEAPTDIALSNSSLPENAGANAVIGTLSATDPDAGSAFTYSLAAGTGDTNNASFNISGTSLRANASFNFEVKSSYSIRVRVTDNTGLTYSEPFAIAVTNVNEAPTAPVLSNNSVAENSPVNTTVGTLSATDPDSGTTLSYFLVAGTGDQDNSGFNISGAQLRTSSSFNFESKSSYSIRVAASDGSLSTPAQFTVVVTNVNESPIIDPVSNQVLIENTPRNIDLVFSDPDGSTPTPSVSGGSPSTVSASIVNNVLTLTPAENYNTTTPIPFTITVTDGALSSNVSFSVTVNEVNTAPTDLFLSPTAIDENKPVGTDVGTLTTEDVDGISFTYSFESGTGDIDNAIFSIVGDKLKSGAVFDFETKSSYSVRIKTSDGSLSYSRAFAITISNVNESPDSLVLSNNSLPENCGANALVGSLSATDPDIGSVLTYSLVSGTGSTDNTSFNISGDSLRANASFNFEAKSNYSIRVRVADAGGLYYEKTFAIIVTDVNEAPTDIVLSPNTIAENNIANAVVGTLSSDDPDIGQTLVYTLVTGVGADDNAVFNISGDSLRVTTANALNFEVKSAYTVRVRVSDGSLSYEEALDIIVTNVNETPTDISLSNSVIAENSGANAIVGLLSAIDPDAGTVFAFSLVPGTGDTNNALFNISGSALRAANDLDYETTPSLSVRIRVSDGSLTYSESFAITVINVNEAPTNLNLSKTTIVENAGANALVGSLSATDPDAGSTFTYSLVAGTGDTNNASFNISGTSLRANVSFNFEVKNSYLVRLRVTDAGGLYYERAFTITVTNVNETLSSPSLSNTAIPENSAAGTIIGYLSATDPDANTTFTYNLVAGTGDTDNSSFTIVGNSLRSGAVFNFEAKSSYSVRVSATDGQFITSRAFTITVTDVNEAPTSLALDSYNINENEPTNSIVGYLSATDPDTSPVFTYSLVSGTGDTDNAKFNISGTALRSSAVFNYETDTNYSIRAQVSDGSLTYSRALTISIIDVNEAPVLAAISNQTLSENTNKNITLSASDPDGTTPTLSVSGGSTATVRATISGSTLTLIPATNYSTASPITFTVTASDGTLTATRTFTAIVNDVNSAPVADSDSINVYEGFAYTGTLGASDGDGDTLTRSVVSGPSKGTVTITNTTTGAFTYTANGGIGSTTDSFTFRVTDGTTTSNTATITVAISNLGYTATVTHTAKWISNAVAYNKKFNPDRPTYGKSSADGADKTPTFFAEEAFVLGATEPAKPTGSPTLTKLTAKMYSASGKLIRGADAAPVLLSKNSSTGKWGKTLWDSTLVKDLKNGSYTFVFNATWTSGARTYTESRTVTGIIIKDKWSTYAVNFRTN